MITVLLYLVSIVFSILTLYLLHPLEYGFAVAHAILILFLFLTHCLNKKVCHLSLLCVRHDTGDIHMCDMHT